MFTHVNATNQPTMVNVSDKSVSYRTAEALTRMTLPAEAMALLVGDELQSPKGPVFATAIIAGTMAAKRTDQIIPFCHSIPLEGCKIEISVEGYDVLIRCKASTSHKTGVEMEALIGSSVAALTIYDMCKAISHDIRIQETRLLAKTGGRRDFNGRDNARSTTP